MSRGQSAPAAIVAEARRLYEETWLTGAEIGRLSGLAHSTLRGYVQREGWRRPGDGARPVSRIDALRARIDREIAAAEATLGAGRAERPAAAEKMARTLASMVKTLRELWKFDEERARAARVEPAHDVVTDYDEFRRELARRLDRLRAQYESG